MVVVGIVVSAAHTVSIAACARATPEKLWDAYPLDPGQEGAEPPDPAPTPTAAAVARRSGSPARSAASEGDGGAGAILALIGGAAFVVGLGRG